MRRSRLLALTMAAVGAAAGACSSFSSDAEPPSADAGSADGANVADASPAADGSAIPDAAASGYRAEVLADDPIAYWRMVPDAKQAVADETGRGHTLSLSGSFDVTNVAAATNDGDNATRFDGLSASGSSDKPQDFDFAGSGAFTVELWAKRYPLDGGSELRAMFYAMADSPAKSGYALTESASNNTVQFDVQFGDGGVVATSKPLIAAAWHHYVVVRDATSLTIYVDGDVSATRTLAGQSIPARTSPVTIGSRINTGDRFYYSGLIDEVAVYDKALPPSRIVAHYAKAK